MKKNNLFIVSAVVAVFIGALGFAKTAAPKTVVLVKGIQIQHCGKDVKDNGSIDIAGIDGVKITVKKGKFDLVVPVIPKFNEDVRQANNSDFGDAKVYLVNVLFNNSKRGEYIANGTAYLSFKLIYSDRDVKGTLDEEKITLKKGWNIVGKKNKPLATCPCVG